MLTMTPYKELGVAVALHQICQMRQTSAEVFREISTVHILGEGCQFVNHNLILLSFFMHLISQLFKQTNGHLLLRDMSSA